MRLDQYLVEKGLAPSRARAQALVKAGKVLVSGAVVSKASKSVVAGDEVTLSGQVHDYVSRGGVKLAAALAAFPIIVDARVCLDLGASTGGFCDVLLRAGAAKIYAVDVGHGQLHEKIADDTRVINLERTHAKDLSSALIPDEIELLVIDVSFISLRKVLPPALMLCGDTAQLVVLVKPQFEVGPDNIGKGGLVKESFGDTRRVAEEIGAWLIGQGWQVLGIIDSPITGGDGNREYLLAAERP